MIVKKRSLACLLLAMPIVVCALSSVAFSADTVLVAGGNWCMGQGVNVYSNQSGTHQCTELAWRLYTTRGWHSGLFGIQYAYQIWTQAVGNMQKHAKGSGYVPVPGDMVVFNSSHPGSGGAGHVSVVDRMEGSTVQACEQNASSTGRTSYNLNSMPSTCYGFVHDPDNPLTQCTAATVSWTSTPASGWYNSDHQLTYSVGGTSPINVVESPPGMWISGKGQGWHDDYSVTVSNACGSDSKTWQGGWDTVAPSTNFTGPAISTWLPAGASVGWNPTDGTSGVVSSSFAWDNGSTNGTIPEGIHNVTVSATDRASNTVTETHGPYWLDTVVPVITLSGPATSTWITTPQTITWEVTDATSGFGNGTLTWDTGASSAISASGSATLLEGKHQVNVAALDAAGNLGSTSGGPYWIDTFAPVVTLTPNPAAPNGENDWYTVIPTVTVSAIDPNGSNGSGVQNRFYSIDGSEQPYTAEVTLSDGGVHFVVGRATDVAGNSGQLGVEVRVDTTAPVLAAIHTQPESGVLDTLSASWECGDPDSAVAEYEYSIYRETGDTDELIAGPVTTTEPYAQEISLALARGETYYFIVRAKNNAGLYSNYIASDAITATDGIRDVAPSFNSGGVSVPAEARRSDNYMIVDSLGQFVVDTSTSGGVVLESGYWHSEVTTTPVETVAIAKATENNKLIQLGSPDKPVVVTVSPGMFTDRFYVEQPDRSSGIAVSFGEGLGMSLIPGNRVWILGTLNTVDGERVIQYAAPTFVFQSDPLGALFVNNSWLGGSDLNLLTKGIENAAGLNNLGLLVKTCGRVGKIDSAGTYFYINDGSNLSDGTKTDGEDNIGVRAAGDGRSYTSGQFVTVTGISSCFIDGGGKSRRLIRPVVIEPLQ